MEQPGQPQPPQPVTTAPATATTTVILGPAISSSNTTLFDEGFENFFNNESLSDRILNIIETEKVSPLYLLNFFFFFEILIRIE